MKKVLFASAAALCAVVGLSSFNSDARVNVRYFQVTPDLTASTTNTLQDSQVTFYDDENPGDICVGAGKLCIVSIATVNLTAGKQHLAAGAQPIQTKISTRTIAD